MTLRPILCASLLLALAACQTPYKKADEEEKKPMKDQSNDQAFQSFLGRLRTAVSKRDKSMLGTMMTPDFGYRWDTPPPGELAWDYWDKQNLWGELGNLLNQRFVPKELYMVAPPQVVLDPNYKGYRVGMRVVRGSWKLAYFVSGDAPPQ